MKFLIVVCVQCVLLLRDHLNSPTFFFFGLEDGRSAGSDVTGRDYRRQKREDGHLFLVSFTFF